MIFDQGRLLVWVDDQIDYAVLAGCLQQLDANKKLDIHFISVVPGKTRLKWLEPVDQQQLTQALIDSRYENMKRRLADHQITFDADKLQVLVGKPVTCVCQFAEEQGFDLVVKAADVAERTSTEDMALLRRCPKPVLLVKSGSSPIRKIVAAVDVSDEMEFLFNHQILSLAQDGAKALNADLSLVSCWAFEYEADLRDSPFYGQNKEQIDNAVEAERQRLDRELKGMIPDQPESSVLLKGPVVGTLSEYIEAENTDLVVMGTLARTGLPGWIVGNTAEQLLPEISCSILAVKPVEQNS